MKHCGFALAAAVMVASHVENGDHINNDYCIML